MGMTEYPLYRRFGGPPSQSGQVQIISPHRDFIPGPYSLQHVTIPATLSRPIKSNKRPQKTENRGSKLHWMIKYSAVKTSQVCKTIWSFVVVWSYHFTTVKIMLTASAWMGWTANSTDASRAARWLAPPKRRLNIASESTDTVACRNTFIRWNPRGWRPPASQ